MKHFHFPSLLFLPLLASAQIKMEKPPSFEDYLAVEHAIDSPTPVDAAPMGQGLKGMRDDRPEVRTAASVAEEVRAHQGRLIALYRLRKVKGLAAERYFSVSLTLGPEGDVQAATVLGLSDRDFQLEVEAAIRMWTFSRVKERKPMQARLRNLDFLYRKERVLE